MPGRWRWKFVHGWKSFDHEKTQPLYGAGFFVLKFKLARGLVMPEQRQKNDDRKWNTDQPKQKSTTKAHCFLLIKVREGNDRGRSKFHFR
jgi:hypothetical protein